MVRIIKRADLAPWPRVFHNLFESRETELAATLPLATVCPWIGNSKLVAAGHYLQVADADWTRSRCPEPGGGARREVRRTRGANRVAAQSGTLSHRIASDSRHL